MKTATLQRVRGPFLLLAFGLGIEGIYVTLLGTSRGGRAAGLALFVYPLQGLTEHAAAAAGVSQLLGRLTAFQPPHLKVAVHATVSAQQVCGAYLLSHAAFTRSLRAAVRVRDTDKYVLMLSFKV